LDHNLRLSDLHENWDGYIDLRTDGDVTKRRTWKKYWHSHIWCGLRAVFLGKEPR
jgi:hypothetical protein